MPTLALYLEDHPVQIRSYLGRLVARTLGLGAEPMVKQKTEVARALLHRLIHGLEERGLTAGFGQTGEQSNHFNGEGNRIVAGALLEFVDRLRT